MCGARTPTSASGGTGRARVRFAHRPDRVTTGHDAASGKRSDFAGFSFGRYGTTIRPSAVRHIDDANDTFSVPM
jgi:hypothetical protein